MPAMPVAGLPLSESFDALAARARGGDASASMRLVRDMRRCQQREMLATILSLPELRPAQEDELPPELRETRNARLAEQKRVRDEAQKKLAASEALCDGVTPAELATLGEWLERAADSGDPGAAFCYVIAATSDGYAPSDRYSDEWVAWMQRYRSKAYAYSERAFEAGYAMASLYLYDVAAGPYISTPAFPLDPDLPADLERAYGFALLHLDLIERHASPFGSDDAEGPAWQESAQTLAANLDAVAIARAQAWAHREAARIASSTPPAPPCSDDADST